MTSRAGGSLRWRVRQDHRRIVAGHDPIGMTLFAPVTRRGTCVRVAGNAYARVSNSLSCRMGQDAGSLGTALLAA